MNKNIETLNESKDSINKLVEMVSDMLRTEAECKKQNLQSNSQ